MLNTRCLARATLWASRTPRTCRDLSSQAGNRTRVASHPYAQRRQQHFVRSVAAIAAFACAGTALQWYNGPREIHAEEPPQKAELSFEKPRRQASSAEDNRELISSQHVQVKNSWENPGVYLWGSNAGGVAAPDSKEKYIKTPRRLHFFDNVLLRDIKLDMNFGVAIDEKGDLLQWGRAFSPSIKEPIRTLKGKNLVSCSISRDRIIALSSSGTVYSVPVSQEEQEKGPKPATSSWIPFMSGSDNISYRIRTPSGLGFSEKVTQIASGQEHSLLLTSAGRLFSFASASQDFPKRGQLGIPGLTWETRPAGAFDIPQEVSTLKDTPISKIAAGDYHSIISDTAGHCYTFGDNTAGQLGIDLSAEISQIDSPTVLFQRAKVTDVFAGGNTSFMTVDVHKPTTSPRNPSPVFAETWAFGYGLTGQLGVGRWIHNQRVPIKIPALSDLTEFDEKTNSIIPIRVSYISAGATHAAAVLDNVASIDVSGNSGKGPDDINWGKDILFFGNNEFYQIGSGKRSNVSAPTYIQALDEKTEDAPGLLSWGKEDLDKKWHRFQITPRKKVKVGGRTVNLEQKVECGRGVTAVYSAV